MPTLSATKLRNLLLADGNVAALVGTRIYYPYFPGDPTLPAVYFRLQGGIPEFGAPLRHPSVQMFCHADTDVGARTLYETVRTAMMGDPADPATQEAVLRTYGIIKIWEEQEAVDQVDVDGADKGTPFILGFFVVHINDV